MPINDVDFFDAPTVSNAASESDEVFRAQVARSIAGIRRTKADEKKAGNSDRLLTEFLQRVLYSNNSVDKSFADLLVRFLGVGSASSTALLFVSLYDYDTFSSHIEKIDRDIWEGYQFDQFMHIWAPKSFLCMRDFSILQSKKFLVQQKDEKFLVLFQLLFISALQRFSLSEGELIHFQGIILQEMVKKLESLVAGDDL